MPINSEVNIVKIYACRKATKSSRRLIKSAKNTAAGDTKILLSIKIILRKDRITIWPAVMLANNRIHNAKGLVNCPMISTGIIMGKSQEGMPGGITFCK